MKALWKYSFVVVIAAVGMALAACSKSNTSSGSSPCPAGTTFDGTNCLNYINAMGVPAGTQVAFFTQSSNMTYFSPTNANGTATMQLGQGMNTLLQYDMGVCNRQTYSGGNAACSTWYNGFHDMVILMNGSSANEATLIVRSALNPNPFYQFYYSLPDFQDLILGYFGLPNGAANTSGVFDPLVLKMTVWPINGSQGFELRSATSGGPTGSYGWWRALQFQVLNGKITDPNFNFSFYIDGGNQQMQTIMTGKMVRCTTQNCGLQGY